MLSKEQILSTLREEMSCLNEKYSVKAIGLFGSFLNGTNHNNSDIDLLVELEKPIGWDFLFLELYLENLFSRKVDLILKGKVNPLFEQEVLENVEYVQLS